MRCCRAKEAVLAQAFSKYRIESLTAKDAEDAQRTLWRGDCPRSSRLDKALYACDELCGFITACALVRPTRLEGLEPKSVRKKLKQASFAANVNRDDIARGAADFGVDLDEHIAFCICAMRSIAADLGLAPEAP